MRKTFAVLTAGALASAVAASALTAAAGPAAAVPSAFVLAPPYVIAQPVCTDGTPTTGDLRGGQLGDDMEYRVLADTADGSPDEIASGMASGSGDFVSTGVAFPAAPATGITLRLLANVPDPYSTTDNWVEVATRVVGRCQIVPDPASVDVGSLPRTVHVTGTGWPRSARVGLVVDGVSGATVVAPPSGDIATDVTLPVRPCGAVPLRAVVLPAPVVTGTLALPTEFAPGVPFRLPQASTTVTVVCPAPTPTPVDTPTPTPTPVDTPTPTPTPVDTPTPTPTPTPTTPSGPAATLTVDPLLASGGVGTAHGTGFAPGRAVTLTWTLPDGSTAPGAASAVADAAGRFAAQCLVLPRARLGVRTLQAVQPAPAGTTSAAASTLVVNGPMEPGRNRLLGRR